MQQVPDSLVYFVDIKLSEMLEKLLPLNCRSIALLVFFVFSPDWQVGWMCESGGDLWF